MVGQHQPAVVLLMHPELHGLVLPAHLMDRLNRVVRVVGEDSTDDPYEARLPTSPLDDVEIVLSGWGCPRLDEEWLNRLPSLRLVAHAAGSVRPLVSDALWRRGITVTSAAAANAIPVAEFTFASIIMANKDVFAIRDRHRSTRGGHPPEDGVGAENHGPLIGASMIGRGAGNKDRRIGLIGASTIGRLVADRLRTLDVVVVVYDPLLSPDEAQELNVTKVELDDLLETSDVVSLHAPALPSTKHMLGVRELGLMSDGSWLINTARGSLIEPAALDAELRSGRLNAIIDTPEPEPLPPGSPLYDLSNVVLTPHIAGAAGGEVSRMGESAVVEIERFVAGQSLVHPVTRADLEHIA